MSMHAMVMGSLVSDPVQRTGQSGRPFTTATLRVPCEDGEAFLASLIAFSQAAAESLAQYHKGDTLVAGGRASLKQWEGRDGETRTGVGIVVEQVMSTYQFAKRRTAAAAGVEQ